jgi:hypothetical protein
MPVGDVTNAFGFSATVPSGLSNHVDCADKASALVVRKSAASLLKHWLKSKLASKVADGRPFRLSVDSAGTSMPYALPGLLLKNRSSTARGSTSLTSELATFVYDGLWRLAGRFGLVYGWQDVWPRVLRCCSLGCPVVRILSEIRVSNVGLLLTGTGRRRSASWIRRSLVSLLMPQMHLLPGLWQQHPKPSILGPLSDDASLCFLFPQLHFA